MTLCLGIVEAKGVAMPVPVGVEGGVKRQLRKNEVFDRLLEAILDGTLEPGERIRDGDLQEWFGVSRTPIRLALDRLEEMGLIESRPNRFTRVCDVVPARVPQLLQVMTALWALGSRLAVESMNAAEASECLDRLGRASAACRQHSGENAAAAVAEMRHALFYFSEVSGNRLLTDLVVRFGASLRFQLARQGDRLELELMASVFDRLADAVRAADGAAAERVFLDLHGRDILVSGGTR